MPTIDPHVPTTPLDAAAPPSGQDSLVVRRRWAGRGVVNPVVMGVGPVLVIVTVAASVFFGVTAWSPTVPSWALAVALISPRPRCAAWSRRPPGNLDVIEDGHQGGLAGRCTWSPRLLRP